MAPSNRRPPSMQQPSEDTPQQRRESPQAPTVRTSPKGRRTVTVANKMPIHIELQLCESKTAAVTGQFGSVKETVGVKTGKVYVIRGTGHPVGTLPKGFPKPPNMIEGAGYALTPNVDADWFDEWLEQNKDTDMVRNKVVFAHSEQDYLEGIAMEHAHLRSGLDPMDPEGDSRSPKPLNPSVSLIATEKIPTQAG